MDAYSPRDSWKGKNKLKYFFESRDQLVCTSG